MSKNSIKKARQRLFNWSAKGSNCPLCHKDFRHGCNHSVTQAIARLEQNVVNAMIDNRLKSSGLL